MGSVGYMLSSALDATHTLRRSITLSAELDPALSAERQAEVEAELRSLEGVVELSFLSKEEKIGDEEFRRMFASEIESVLEDNPLRNSFEVMIASMDREATDQMVDRMSAIEGVVYVAYPASTIERLHSTVGKITLVLAVFGGALLVISLILLNNTIRLAIFSRRYLINTLKLVGATKFYIMRPFILTSLKQGFWAGLVASIMLGAVLAAMSGALPEIVSTSELIKIGIVVGAMLVGGMLLSLTFTTIAVNKFVNMKSNKIYLY
jgi:cell division transport system permease protein